MKKLFLLLLLLLLLFTLTLSLLSCVSTLPQQSLTSASEPEPEEIYRKISEDEKTITYEYYFVKTDPQTHGGFSGFGVALKDVFIRNGLPITVFEKDTVRAWLDIKTQPKPQKLSSNTNWMTWVFWLIVVPIFVLTDQFTNF